MKSRVILGIAILAIYIFFKKGNKFFKYYENIKKKKMANNIIKLVMIIITAILLYNCYTNIKSCILSHEEANKDKEYFKSYQNRSAEQDNFYYEIINKNYEDEKYKQPYIPNNYNFVEGTWESGFVIEDSNMNQYVWVPCTNSENSEVELLQKDNDEVISKLKAVLSIFIKIEECIDENYEAFLTSALENGGFYISRFEIGRENDVPVSKKDVEVWGKVSQLEAKEIIKNIPKDESINIELANGYAYDTVLRWIEESNEIMPEITLIKDKIMYCGRNKYNNIYDLFDNILELTSEEYYETIILRGYMYEENGVWQNRFNIRKEENYFVENKSLVGFRTILYK